MHDSLIAAHFNDIADMKGVFKDDEESGNDIGDQVTRPDTDCHTGESGRRHECGRIEAKIDQADARNRDDGNIIRRAAQKPCDGFAAGIADLSDHAQDPAHRCRRNDADQNGDEIGGE